MADKRRGFIPFNFTNIEKLSRVNNYNEIEECNEDFWNVRNSKGHRLGLHVTIHCILRKSNFKSNKIFELESLSFKSEHMGLPSREDEEGVTC